ncbi:hypothetical protein Dimus_015721 [Dionaea muscipula]
MNRICLAPDMTVANGNYRWSLTYTPCRCVPILHIYTTSSEPRLNGDSRSVAVHIVGTPMTTSRLYRYRLRINALTPLVEVLALPTGPVGIASLSYQSLLNIVGLPYQFSYQSFASSSCIGTVVLKSTCFSAPSLTLKSRGYIKLGRRPFHILVSEGNSRTTDSSYKDSKNGERPLAPSQDASPPSRLVENSSGGNRVPQVSDTSVPKRASLTAREKLRAARVLSRYSESNAVKPEMGSKVLDAIREVEKGKKGLPEAPTNIFDDSKRGMPKQGLTFDFPGTCDDPIERLVIG